MSPRLDYDPLESGPRPLLPEAARSSVDKMIDKLQANLTAAIVKAVYEGAQPLFRRGYRINELQILGFGPEITVEPIKEYRRLTLLWRRILLALRLRSRPSFQQYGQITALDCDTRRLIKQLKIFETCESPEAEKGVWRNERRIGPGRSVGRIP